MAEMTPNTARNWRRERFRKYTMPLPYAAKPELNGRMTSPQSHRDAEISAEKNENLFSSDASHADQVSENDAFQGLRGGHSGVAAAAAHRHGLEAGTVCVEGAGIALAGGVVEIQFHAGPGFGVAQFQFAGPRRHAVFIRPDLQEHQ